MEEGFPFSLLLILESTEEIWGESSKLDHISGGLVQLRPNWALPAHLETKTNSEVVGSAFLILSLRNNI